MNINGHTHTCAGTHTQQCVRHPAWQACMRLCVEGCDTRLLFSFFTKPQRAWRRGLLRGNVELWQDCYHITVRMCALLLALTLFTQPTRSEVWSVLVDLKREKSDWCFKKVRMKGSCSANAPRLFNSPHRSPCKRTHAHKHTKIPQTCAIPSSHQRVASDWAIKTTLFRLCTLQAGEKAVPGTTLYFFPPPFLTWSFILDPPPFLFPLFLPSPLCDQCVSVLFWAWACTSEFAIWGCFSPPGS